jgi:hypothetical protein
MAATDIGASRRCSIKRLARTRKVNPDTMMIGPEIDQMSGKLSPIIGKQISRRSTLPHQVVHNLNNMLATELRTNLDLANAPRLKISTTVRGLKFLAVTQLVMHKIKAPSLFRTPGSATSTG